MYTFFGGHYAVWKGGGGYFHSGEVWQTLLQPGDQGQCPEW